jgi:hypothetical protein
MKELAAALVVMALLGTVAGILFASQATAGVALVSASCLLAILARMAQASAHHEALMRQIEDARTGKPVPVRLG